MFLIQVLSPVSVEVASGLIEASKCGLVGERVEITGRAGTLRHLDDTDCPIGFNDKKRFQRTLLTVVWQE